MSKFKFSSWLSSSEGPLVVMDEAKAASWNGIDGQPSDYDLACQTRDYTSKLTVHGAGALVLADEPLQTAIATAADTLLLVRWKWADGEADVQAEVEKMDLGTVSYVEKLDVEWIDRQLVMFDAADVFDPRRCLAFVTSSRRNKILTFMYEPTPRTSLLVHAFNPF
ncbi:Imm21 family immunity protein [Caballeronia sp. Lep1P3]|uniref:Imm21 family immunity protein n=1 Tax=Caballeronia sp. Lep1P3 TaxID=2878150 RepID=UPI001FD32928|nr:Imm21 family immunity protein [Caballeronia sp. Lep1P3]